MIADFDATLTKFWVNGTRGQSMLHENFVFPFLLPYMSKITKLAMYYIYLIESFVGSHGLLQQDNPEYDAKRQQLYEHYHPLEFSPTLGLEEKRKLMEEWYVIQFLNAGLHI